jgi:hypothetical protein
MGDPAVGKKATVVGGEPAVRFGVHRSIQQDYVSVTLVLHNGRLYQFLLLGVAGKDAAADDTLAQIMTTIQFTS